MMYLELIAGDLMQDDAGDPRIYTGALVNTILQIHSLEGLNGGEGHTVTLPYYWLVATNMSIFRYSELVVTNINVYQNTKGGSHSNGKEF